MFNISESFKSIWHAVTTNDRHADYNSPYRTGQHVPIPQSHHAPLSTVATSASESRLDLNSPTPSDSLTNGVKSQSQSQSNSIMSPVAPYSPGMRSIQRGNSSDIQRRSSDKSPVVDIQMRDFSDGLPPPPPVDHTWRRIERWMIDNYSELYDNLCEGCTNNDVNELEHQLDCTLPQDVRESLHCHDGQERGGRPTGVIFGSMLLDCEEIVEEWSNWQAVNEQYLNEHSTDSYIPTVSSKSFAGPSSSAPSTSQTSQPNGAWKDTLLSKQESQPPNAVQKAYAHRSWIPLVKDWGGNCLAVDLAPGPSGRWGQVIIFGRDFDCKYVVATSWAAFLANFADDINSGDKVHIDEETKELKLLPFKKQGVEPPYLNILRWRCDQRYGRRPPTKRASGSSLRINPNSQGPAFESNSSSPYASPTGERGQSPARSSGKAPMIISPTRPLISSPLARVAEEHSAMNSMVMQNEAENLQQVSDKLISVELSTPPNDFPSPNPLGETTNLPKEKDKHKENRPISKDGIIQSLESGVSSDSKDHKESTMTGASQKDIAIPVEEMKTVII